MTPPAVMVDAVDLLWSSYLGGSSSDYGNGIAVDSDGNAWITGDTGSSDFASGGFDTLLNDGLSAAQDAFVAKVNADGTLAWSSYLGGSDYDYGRAIAVDSDGNAYVTGSTDSSDWASGGFDTTYNDGGDAFVAKINANGTLAWTSYLGGTDFDDGTGIAVDSLGNVWVTGYTRSNDLASGGFDTTFNGGDLDAFIAKINANGTLAWTSYLGGSGDDQAFGIALDSNNNAWVTGVTDSTDLANGGFETTYNGGNHDAFVAKINANGTLAWSSYLGEFADDFAYGISVDSGGNAWVTGITNSTLSFAVNGFDTTYNGGSLDAFVSKINANGSLAWISYLGGDRDDAATGITIDGDDNAWVTGFTYSSDMANGGFDNNRNGYNDAFLTKINANGSLAWTSLLGGNGFNYGTAVATDAAGDAWLAGWTGSSDLAVSGFDTASDGGDEAFIAKISESAALTGGISVTGNGVSITDGDATPSATDHTDFGSVGPEYAVNVTTVTRTFTITNTGTAILALGTVAAPSGFTVTKSLTPYLAPGQSDTLIVELDNSVPATYSGEVLFPTSVSNQNHFNFAITGTVKQITHTDFNADGYDDIVFRNSSTGLNVIWLMQGATKLGSVGLPTVADTHWTLAAVGDMDADGDPDLVWRNTSTGINIIWTMDGSTKTGSVGIPTVADTNWTLVGLGDYNYDYKNDLVWRNTSTGQNTVWFMNGTTKTGSKSLPTVADTNWTIVGMIYDFPGDYNPNLLWRNTANGQQIVWQMYGASKTGSYALPTLANANWVIAGTLDTNADGISDILWRNQSTGQTITWTLLDSIVSFDLHKSGSLGLPTVSSVWEAVV